MVNAQEVRCPPVIVDGSIGAYGKRSSDSGRFPFRCFSSDSIPKRKKLPTVGTQSALDYTGWYRLSVVPKSNTCSSTSSRSATPASIFLQVKDFSKDLFAEICPTSARYTGRQTKDGFIVSTSELLSEDPDESYCPTGALERTTQVDFRKSTKTGAGTVGYRIIKRCLAPSDTRNYCTIEYSGSAVKETSLSHFPAVTSKLSEFADRCAAARINCLDCHSN